MKTWITLGLIKKRVNKKCKYVYVLKRGKPIKKRSIFRNSKPIFVKDFLDQKLKNPLTQRINFLHGICLVLLNSFGYCTKFILDELKDYCRNDDSLEISRLKDALLEQYDDLYFLNSTVQAFHDLGCNKEDIENGVFGCYKAAKNLNDLDSVSRCPCSNPIYFHYNRKMENCLTKHNAAFRSKYLSSRQILRNQRTFFLTLQKCSYSLSDINTKQYDD
ncbi:uncharacterized protein LOC129928030 isoform X2 [Biomphalaria glabrata]|uniref:Uncharacterized protein LOC129928030 isoform X2 n=1 Tax=Biomphalaria glabrata TaxID=6526 RepID=A0A9W3B8N0_BIOGL|nr:uncharacterized protein LOC129928030 isoform X2 [Biomphalaria glabrata]